MKIVVIGGSGLIGSKLVSNLGECGHEAVSASPNTGVNTLTGEGLAEEFIRTERHRFLGPGGPDDPFASDPWDD